MEDVVSLGIEDRVRALEAEVTHLKNLLQKNEDILRMLWEDHELATRFHIEAL